MKTPKLTVVGAGPGDPELITLKAIKAIASADVILYDALINVDLLEYASDVAELIFVGKRKGCYAYQQDQINDLIVARAKSHGHVLRLKGGDPFIFGPNEQLPNTISGLPSPLRSPTSIVSHLPTLVSGKVNGINLKSPLFSR